MEWPGWVREPDMFLRYLIPGFMLLACAAAFFPQTLTDATRAVPVAANRSDLTALLWIFWAMMIGIVFHSFYQVVYEILLRPSPRPQDVVRRALERVALPGPPLRVQDLRALYAMTLSAAADEATLKWARQETHRVHLGYQGSIIVAVVGLLIAAHPVPGPLVSVPWAPVQGVAMAIGAGAFALLFAVRRDAVVRQAEVASVRWDSEKVMAQLATWALTMQRARGELHDVPVQGPPPAAGMPPR